MSFSHQLILGSNSPRRRELLANMGFSFDVFTQPIDESYPGALKPKEVAKHLAELKNNIYRSSIEDQILLTADTIVVLNGSILGKPANPMEAYNMISKLSNDIHSVITGVCISSPDNQILFTDETQVAFKPLSQNEIRYYVKKYAPFDKAGAYGIQEWIGLIGVTSIKGSYFNVMGLPTEKVYNILTDEFGLFPK
ncbi:MAG: Maf family nucleotide pyrophosphatase [Bacteroidetes bacterium]|nr:Maf family nucleotide pyrophosphatase [Bacteroidota bacterium]